MKNRFAPLAILGLSGLGLACASQGVQERVQLFFKQLTQGADPLAEVNRFFDEQLRNIQQTPRSPGSGPGRAGRLALSRRSD